MENFRTLFFPQYPEKKDDRTKRCDSVPSAESRYDHYKRNFADRDANRLQSERISEPSS